MKQYKTMSINKKEFFEWLGLVLLSFPHIKPGYTTVVAMLDSIFDGGKVISFLAILAWLFFIKCKISKIAILICTSELYVLAITFIRGGAVWKCIVDVLSVVSIVLLYDVVKGNKILYSSQLFCFEIVIYINLLTEILYPETMYIINSSADNLNASTKCWFLGYYNNHSKWFIPALLFAFLYKNKTGKKLRAYCLTVAIFASAILAWSGGVLVSIFGMALIYIFYKNRTRIFNFYSYWILQVVFFVMVIILKLQNVFRWIIDDILGKWNSLEARMVLWNRTILLILRYPLFGHGVWKSIDREIQLNIYWGCHAHNMFLEILYRGGIIYLNLFIGIILMAGKPLFLHRNSNESKIISIAFFGWCVHSLVDPFISSFLVGMFVIAYYSNDRLLKPIVLKRDSLLLDNAMREKCGGFINAYTKKLHI